MGWPLSQDYNEAIQNPAFCFHDAELRQGEAVTGALGLPLPRSGNFADVYEVRCPQSGGRWAVKCFTRQVPGLRERYAEVSAHLRQARLPFTVDFQYLADGIRVEGQWYPVVKMQWVEGLLLNEFVRGQLDRPAALDALAQIWCRMARRLREAGVAHADLQHGNVLLVPGTRGASLAVKLIDYDGMFVPALAQSQSGEVGHPNYQHPQRLREGTYSAAVDRFPLLAVAAALRCLRVGGRSLWERHDNGDNLLFKEADLKAPAESALFRELWQLDDAVAHALVGYTALASQGRLEQAPLVDQLLEEGTTPALTGPQEQQVAALLGVSGLTTAVRVERPQVEAGTAATGAFDFGADDTPAVRISSLRRPERKPLPGWVWAAAGAGVMAGVVGAAFLMLGPGGGRIEVPAVAQGKPSVMPTGQNTAAQPAEPERKVSQKGPAAQPEPKKDPPLASATDPLPPPPPSEEPPAGGVGEVRQFNGPTARVFKLAFSPDGRSLLSGAADGSVRLWEVATGKEIRAFPGHSRDIRGVAFSPDGRQVLSASDDATARLWQVADGTELHRFRAERPIDGFHGVVFSLDGRQAITAGNDGYLRRWDLTSRTETAALRVSDAGVSHFSPRADGRVVLAHHWNSSVREGGAGLWDLDAGTQLRLLKGKGFSGPLALSPDGKQAVSGMRGTSMHLWEVETGRTRHRLGNFQASVRDVTFSRDGKRILSGNADRTVRLWSAETGQELVCFKGHLGTVFGVALSPDGRLAASASADNTVRLWRLPDGDMPVGKPVLGSPVVTGPGVGKSLADRPVAFGELRRYAGHAGMVQSVALTADGRRALSGSSQGELWLWDLEAGSVLRRFDGLNDWVRGAAFSPDGRRAAAAWPDGVRVWDLQNGRELFQFPLSGACAVAFSRDGRLLVAVSHAGSGLGAWDMKTGAGGVSLKGHPMDCLAVLPNGRQVLLGSGNRTLRLCDLTTGAELVRWQGHDDRILAVAVSPDGKQAASASEDRTVKIWNLANGREVKTLKGHSGAVQCVAFLPDGRRLLTGGGPRDGSLRLWDVATGQQLDASEGQRIGPNAVAVSADGRLALYGSSDRTVRLWALPPRDRSSVTPPVPDK